MVGTQPPDDPGGASNVSYAERLKTNVRYDQRLQRNILEISLEKINKEAEIMLNQECIARLFKSVGIDIVNEVEGYQMMLNGGSHSISVWAKEGVNLERFCKNENINVAKGVITGVIRPAGRKDITVTFSGLDFNTPDSLVCNYIEKFGGVVINRNIVYGRYIDGPFHGKYNGERRYQVDFSGSNKYMGTYYYLDGARVRVFYRGNQKTCARCHKTSRNCPGRGIARDCETEGGERVLLTDHMKAVWALIGFCPSSFELPESSEDYATIIDEQPPQKTDVNKLRLSSEASRNSDNNISSSEVISEKLLSFRNE